jgi:hypothetical protein
LAVPTIPVFQAGETTTLTTKLGQVSTALSFLLDPPSVAVYKLGTGSLADASWNAINFDGEIYDWATTAMHSTTTSNSRLVAPESGRYRIEVGVEFAANATGSRRINVRKNSGAVQTSGTSVKFKVVNAVAGAGNETTVDATFPVALSSGDYVEVFAHQTSGGILSVDGGAAATYMSLTFTGRL